MKPVTVETLKNGDYTFTAPVLYYESVEEGDKAAGVQGAMLREANLNLDYRGARADVRDTLVEIVNELTKVEPKQKDTGEKDDKGQPIMEVDEKDSIYIKRALELVPTVTNDIVQKELNRRCNGYTYTDAETKQPVVVPAIAVDVTKKTRQPKGPKVLPAKYKDTAKGILAAKNVDKFNKASAKYGIAAFVATGKPEDEVTLGWLLKRYAEAKAEEAKNEFSTK